MPAGGGDLRFENVSFSYPPGYPILNDFDLHIPAGRSVALVGPTGSGKTTVGKLLPRFYDVSSGRIMIDGADVRDLRLEDLRRNVGLVFQDTFLFSDTIRNNIAYGRVDSTQEEIEQAARLAQAAEFIDELPDGYDTIVGDQGFSLSGGQRQRLAIARAILIRPRVLILDDATSSVDARMEEEIRTALQRVMEGRTTIIISHRMSTIALADQVVLMDEGRVVQTGTHDELLRELPALRRGAGATGGRNMMMRGMRQGMTQAGERQTRRTATACSARRRCWRRTGLWWFSQLSRS